MLAVKTDGQLLIYVNANNYQDGFNIIRQPRPPGVEAEMYIEANSIHIFPHRNDFIVYCPARMSMMVVDQKGLSLLKDASLSLEGLEALRKYPAFLDKLLTFGIVTDEGSCAQAGNDPVSFAPTSVTLFPSQSCNLRCIYCYATAEADVVVMPRHIAEAAIDFVQENATSLGAKTTHLSFHGGCEPFFGNGGKLLRYAHEYAQAGADRRGLRLTTHVATNGVLSKSQLRWIRDNDIALQVGLDGPEDIQNQNRPTSNGSGSFRHVMRTIKYLDTNNISYGIRSTITPDSVGRMSEIVDFICANSRTKYFQLEPLFESGRCSQTGAKAPNAKQFAEEFGNAMQKAELCGRHVRFSTSELKRRNTFCGAMTPNFCITPEGYVTSCYEVLRPSDPRSPTFFYGRYDGAAERQFIFDAHRISRLRGRVADRVKGCEGCVALETCAGDCPAKSVDGDIYNRADRTRCEATVVNLLQTLSRRADQITKGGHHVAV